MQWPTFFTGSDANPTSNTGDQLYDTPHAI